jgi:hypothetical protein
MSDYALAVSVSITPEQLAWLDARRRHGSLSRSAALRQVLDGAIAAEQRLNHTSVLQRDLRGGAVAAAVH